MFDTGAHCTIIPDVLIPEQLKDTLGGSCIVQVKFHGYTNVLETMAQIRPLEAIPNRSRFVILGQHELLELMTFTFRGRIQQIDMLEYFDPLSQTNITFIEENE